MGDVEEISNIIELLLDHYVPIDGTTVPPPDGWESGWQRDARGLTNGSVTVMEFVESATTQIEVDETTVYLRDFTKETLYEPGQWEQTVRDLYEVI